MGSQAKLTRRKGGRPRLGDQPDFYERLYEVMPALRDGTISKGEAARLLGISHRSLNRYLEHLTHVSEYRPLVGLPEVESEALLVPVAPPSD